MDSFLGFSCLEHISYITANFPRMCLMLDQFLWGHSSRDCDISCSDCELCLTFKLNIFLTYVPSSFFNNLANQGKQGRPLVMIEEKGLCYLVQ